METILITGGTGKIGSQLVDHFAQKNDFLVLFTSTSTKKIEDIVNGRKNVIGVCSDFHDKDYLEKLIEWLGNYQVNHLINNARSLKFLGGNEKMINRDFWLGEYFIDVVVPYELSIRISELGNLKRIINVSSMYGVVPFNPKLYETDNQSPFQYSCAKAALIHLTKELSVLLADKGIQVNAISFGGVEGRVDDAFQKRYAALCPMRRMLHDNEVVGAVDFLISDASVYITGHNLVVDGGWSVW
jgi:NAD(P)-dependent dehydrogenase (short-subunit alcohol dehydrogenase family)